MDNVNQIINILESEQWISFKTLKSKCKIPEKNVNLVLNFLFKYGFLEKNNHNQKFRLNPALSNLK